MSISSWDMGKLRAFQRVTSEDGFFHICAIDHQRVLKTLLGEDPDEVEFGQVVALKDQVVRTVADQVSAVLSDARYGAAFLVASGALLPGLGHVVEVGDESYDIPPGLRRTRLRAKWSMEKIRFLGGDFAKLLWFFRPDADDEVAEHQRGVVRSLVQESARLSLPVVVEPIWYPLIGEDTKSAVWKARRAQGIVESAIEASKLGADLLKVEFPGALDTEAERTAARAACAAIDAGVTVPWVLLSGGVDFDGYADQLEVASKAGASGYMAGRSLWQDVVGLTDPAAIADARVAVAARLRRLNAITRKHGRPVRTTWPLAEVLAELPEFWYESWHPESV